MLSEGGGGRGTEVGFETGACASLTERFVACSLQDCEEKVFCFGNAGAVPENDSAAVTETAVGVTEGEGQETMVKDRLKESEDGELGELHFGIARGV